MRLPRFGWDWPSFRPCWRAIYGFPLPWSKSAWAWPLRRPPRVSGIGGQPLFTGRPARVEPRLAAFHRLGRRVLLTFLAGAELDPAVMKVKLKEVTVVGMFGFLAPFLGCAALARFVLGWSGPASWLAGVALSTTSMAVVYAVMLESGFNRTEFGKGILGACFINDLGTVVALGLIFAPFTYRTVVFSACPRSPRPAAVGYRPADRPYGNRTAAIRTKWILMVLCGLVGWRFGREARRCCRPISPAWHWPRRSAATTSLFDGSAR